MATDVTIDVRTDGFKTSSATSLAWNHTITAGLTNPWLLVNNTMGASVAADPTSVKWDTAGVNQTVPIQTTKQETANNNCKTTISGVSPSSSGTKQIRVTFGSSVEITGGSASYQFVNQTTPYDTATTPTTGSSGTSTTLNVNSSAHAMVVSCAVENGGSTLSQTGQTTIHNENIGSSQHAGLSSDKAGAAGTVAMTVSGISNLNAWAHVGVSLIFDGGSGGTTFSDSVAESLTAAETENATAAFVGAGAETLSATATQTATLQTAAAAGETLSAADSETGTVTTAAAASEALTASDSETGTVTTAVSRAESLSATDAQDATVTAGGTSSTSDALSASDVVSATVIFAAAVGDALSAADTEFGPLTTPASRAESLSAADTATATLIAQGITTESLAAADSVLAAVSMSVAIHELLAAVDAVSSGSSVPEYPPGRFTLDDIQPRFALDDISPRFALNDPQATFTLREDYPA